MVLPHKVFSLEKKIVATDGEVKSYSRKMEFIPVKLGLSFCQEHFNCMGP